MNIKVGEKIFGVKEDVGDYYIINDFPIHKENCIIIEKTFWEKQMDKVKIFRKKEVKEYEKK